MTNNASDRNSSSSNRNRRSGGGGGERSSRSQPQRSKSVEILPHPEVLEGYNYVIEGSAERILSMFEAEQRHRHAWEDRALQIHSRGSILGQVLGFGIGIAIFVSAALIGMYGNPAIAAFVWVFGLAIVVMSALVWTYAKSMGQRPLFARPALRSSFRPEKNKDES